LKKLKSIIAITLLLTLLLSLSPTIIAAEGSSYTDIDNHWAKSAIHRWSDLKIIQGSGGRFRPNDPIRRGELAAIINRIMKYPSSKARLFDDTAGKWYESDINALAWQGVYLVEQGKALGDQLLTREESVHMIVRSLVMPSANKSSLKVIPTDIDDVAREYISSVTAVLYAEVVSGFPDGSFKPTANITRAQLVTILDNMIDVYIDEPGVYSRSLGGNVVVAAPNVSLSNQNIERLWITPGATGVTTVSNSYVNNIQRWCYNTTGFDRFNVSAKYHGERFIRREYDDRFAGGFGFPWSPYLIQNQSQLELLRDHEGCSSINAHFLITRDISLTGQWTPLCCVLSADDLFNDQHGFWGRLNGDGHTISGLNVRISKNGDIIAGLFEVVSGHVTSLTVTGKVEAISSASAASQGVQARHMVAAGGISGLLGKTGTLDNYTGGITSCVSRVDVSATSADIVWVGGIVGTAHLFVRNCSSFGTVSAQVTSSGDQHNAIAGGIAGMIASSFTLETSLSEASVSATGGYNSIAGGIVGSVQSARVGNCYASGKVRAANAYSQNNAGGVVGHIQETGVVYICAANAEVSVSGNPGFFNSAGGLIGSMYGTNSQCNRSFSAGSVVVTGSNDSSGRLVGRTEGAIKRSYSITEGIEQRYSDSDPLGGFIGSVRSQLSLENNIAFSPDGAKFVSGTYASPRLSDALSKAALLKESSYYTRGFDFSGSAAVWVMPSETDSYKLPMLIGRSTEFQRNIQMPEWWESYP